MTPLPHCPPRLPRCPAAAAALRLQGTALQQAAEAFGPMPAPSPPASKLAAMAGRPTAQPGMASGVAGHAVAEPPPAGGAGSALPAAPKAPAAVAEPVTPVTVEPHSTEAHQYARYPTL